MKIKISTWIVLLIIAMSSGCSLPDKLTFNDEKACPVSSISVDESYAQKISDKVPLHLYFASEDLTGLKMEVRYIPLTDAKKSVQNLAGIIVKELIAGPGSDLGLKSTMPTGTKLLSEPLYKEGNITINLNKDFADKLSKDKSVEKIAIFSIVNSLTELKEIERVKFTFDGSLKKDYQGSLKMDALFSRNPALINQQASVETFEETEVLD